MLEDKSGYGILRVKEEGMEVRVAGEMDVTLTRNGYRPVLIVAAGDKNHLFYVQAKSLFEPLERLRQKNKGKFTGLKFKLRKVKPEGQDYEQYEVQVL